jgi:uncharacterized MAPEG superfamily protein
MTTELWYLFLTSLLLTVLWIPYIIGSVIVGGLLTPEEYRSGRAITFPKFPQWVRRADRAHVNLVEQFGAFAALVVVAHLAGIHTAVTAWCAAIFFWARIVHAVVYLTGIAWGMVRTVVFVIAFLALLVFAWEIFANYQAVVPAA